MLEANLRWTQCKNCQIYHPKNWEIDHGCTAKVQKTFDGKTCLVCEAKFESAEQCYSHMDKLHPNHDHFGQMCEICNGKRPDKTSLMLHKLTHLTSNESSGPKIKIITASEVQGMKKFIKFVITYPHHLGMNFYVNFLGCLGSNGFQLKWRFGIHSN